MTFKPVKGTARSYEGFLHLDHARSTTMPRDIAAGWLRLLVLSGDAHWGLKLRLLDDNASAVGWLWDFKNGSATPIYDAKVDVMGEAGNFSEIWVNGKGLVGRLHITRDKHLFRDAPVEAYGILGLMVKPWVGNPVTNIFRVNWKRGDKSVGTGIMALAEH